MTDPIPIDPDRDWEVPASSAPPPAPRARRFLDWIDTATQIYTQWAIVAMGLGCSAWLALVMIFDIKPRAVTSPEPPIPVAAGQPAMTESEMGSDAGVAEFGSSRIRSPRAGSPKPARPVPSVSPRPTRTAARETAGPVFRPSADGKAVAVTQSRALVQSLKMAALRGDEATASAMKEGLRKLGSVGRQVVVEEIKLATNVTVKRELESTFDWIR